MIYQIFPLWSSIGQGDFGVENSSSTSRFEFPIPVGTWWRVEFRFHGRGTCIIHTGNVVAVPRRSADDATPRSLAYTFLGPRELSRNSLTVKSFRGARRSTRGYAWHLFTTQQSRAGIAKTEERPRHSSHRGIRVRESWTICAFFQAFPIHLEQIECKWELTRLRRDSSNRPLFNFRAVLERNFLEPPCSARN